MSRVRPRLPRLLREHAPHCRRRQDDAAIRPPRVILDPELGSSCGGGREGRGRSTGRIYAPGQLVRAGRGARGFRARRRVEPVRHGDWDLGQRTKLGPGGKAPRSFAGEWPWGTPARLRGSQKATVDSFSLGAPRLWGWTFVRGGDDSLPCPYLGLSAATSLLSSEGRGSRARVTRLSAASTCWSETPGILPRREDRRCRLAPPEWDPTGDSGNRDANLRAASPRHPFRSWPRPAGGVW